LRLPLIFEVEVAIASRGFEILTNMTGTFTMLSFQSKDNF
jgi:hypothetical protein